MTGSRRLQTLGLAGLLGVIGGTAFADCSDFAAPGVYWRRCLQDGQDLRGVDLSGANLADASFKRAELSGADLSGADARKAKFVSAIMRDAKLDQARLVRADLTKADLSGASLRQADLTNARLFRADLSKADLTGAELADADLLKAVFAGATWIDGKTVCAESSVGQCNPLRGAAQGQRRRAERLTPAPAGRPLPITRGAKRSPGRGVWRAAARASRAPARRCARHSARPPRTCRPACPGR